MPLKPLYRPSVQSASLIVRLCVAASLGASALLYFVPELQSIPWAFEGVIALALLATVMGAWHDGHAIGEKKGQEGGRESGSALILILIAVVLFAGLTAIMNQGSRTSTGMVSDQQARLAATEIIQYGNSIKQAVQKLLLQGCSESELDFSNPNWTRVNGTLIHDDHNPNAPQDGRCNVFSPAGGGMQAMVIPASHLLMLVSGPAFTKSGSSMAIRLAVPNVGDSDKEEIAWRAAWIREEVCTKINELLGISNDDNSAPVAITSSISTHYNGSFGNPPTLTDVSGSITGQTAFCISNGHNPPLGGGWHSFIQVLVAR